jgi:hypothetical protein
MKIAMVAKFCRPDERDAHPAQNSKGLQYGIKETANRRRRVIGAENGAAKQIPHGQIEKCPRRPQRSGCALISGDVTHEI